MIINSKTPLQAAGIVSHLEHAKIDPYLYLLYAENKEDLRRMKKDGYHRHFIIVSDFGVPRNSPEDIDILNTPKKKIVFDQQSRRKERKLQFFRVNEYGKLVVSTKLEGKGMEFFERVYEKYLRAYSPENFNVNVNEFLTNPQIEEETEFIKFVDRFGKISLFGTEDVRYNDRDDEDDRECVDDLFAPSSARNEVSTRVIRERVTKFGQFPVSPLKKRLELFTCGNNYVDKIDTEACVYLTSVIEYLVAEILELAGNEARPVERYWNEDDVMAEERKKRQYENGIRIKPTSIQAIVERDEELKEVFYEKFKEL